MRVSVQIGGNKSLTWDIGSEQIAHLVANLEVNNLPEATMTSILEALSQHPSMLVRERVAQRSSLLNSKTLDRLAADNEPLVLREIATSASLNTEQLLHIMTRSTECAVAIARNLEEYEKIDQSKILNELLKHSEPDVISALLSNNRLPKKFLKSLLVHEDPTIRYEATSALERYD
jgi:hypothetical protein